jgi:NADH dehydrogenase
VAEAIALAATHEGFSGQTFELGGPKVYSFREILELVLAEIRRDRLLVPLPFPLAKLIAFFTGVLPNAPLTMDQVELLKLDNVVAEGARTLHDLGIDPTPAESIVGSYLGRFRKQGQFDKPVEAV